MQNSSDPDGYRAHPQQPTRLHHHCFRSHSCAKDQVALELAGLTDPNAMASPKGTLDGLADCGCPDWCPHFVGVPIWCPHLVLVLQRFVTLAIESVIAQASR
jgi:hypothetical protein